jgi:hypothetical protein
MKGLSSNEVAELLATAKGRKGIYGPKLMEFFNGDELAINPRDVWPEEFAKVKIANLSQNFRNAAIKAKILDLIEFRTKGDDLFILHTERAKLAVAQLSEDLDNGNTDEENTDEVEPNTELEA